MQQKPIRAVGWLFPGIALGAAILVLSLALLASPAAATHGGLHTVDLTDPGLEPVDLAEALAGPGVTINPASVVYTGADAAAGAFEGGTGIIGFEAGIILSSGMVADVVGPNESPSTTTIVGTPGDADLTALAGVNTFDAAILEFEFTVVGEADQVFFNYVFGSEEYNEFVGSQFNDVFAFFVNGENCAVVGDPPVPVSINTINNGQPSVDPTNPHLYINNDPFNAESTGETVPFEELLNTEMDGLTVVLTCVADVIPGETNTMRLAIADGADRVLDSWVLIEGGSLTTTPVSLEVTKTADPAFDREFLWSIAKTVDINQHTLETGQSGNSTYIVTVTQTGVDDDHSVSGAITIANPSDTLAATITGVTDTISGVGNAAVDCGVTFPHDLVPGATLVCTYASALPDGATRTNTATVTTTGDVGGGSGQATIDFTGVEPTTTINETVTVADTFAGDLGSFSATGSVSYTRTFICDGDEGTHPNTATINETGQSAGASVTVTCTVDEPPPPVIGDEGCTPGFWRNQTHLWVGYEPDDLLTSVFSGVHPSLQGNNLDDAIRFGGGAQIVGAQRILLRAAVASLLNAAHPDVSFTMTDAQVIAAVNAALASNNRGTILDLASQLDDDNNLGCPIDAHGNRIDD